MNYLKDTKKGKYIVTNLHKYIGKKHPVFKSLWEQKIFFMLDNNPYIKKWGYECQPLPYFNVVAQRDAIYYPDVFFHRVDENGNHKQFLLEIKPYKFTRPPLAPKSRDGASLERYRRQKAAFAINLCKWEAAEKWCKLHHVEWMLVTDKNCKAFTRHKNKKR